MVKTPKVKGLSEKGQATLNDAKEVPSTSSNSSEDVALAQSGTEVQKAARLEIMELKGINDRPMIARVLRPGDRYGLDDCLTWGEEAGSGIRDEAYKAKFKTEFGNQLGLEFYDATHKDKGRFGPLGQFISRYYLSSLNEGRSTDESHASSRGINLHGGVHEWSIGGPEFLRVLAWANGRKEQPEATRAWLGLIDVESLAKGNPESAATRLAKMAIAFETNALQMAQVEPFFSKLGFTPFDLDPSLLLRSREGTPGRGDYFAETVKVDAGRVTAGTSHVAQGGDILSEKAESFDLDDYEAIREWLDQHAE